MLNEKTTLPAPPASLRLDQPWGGNDYAYLAALRACREADRLATQAAARISAIPLRHAQQQTLELCERIVAMCEVRAMQRAARGEV